MLHRSPPTYPSEQGTSHTAHGMRCLLLWVLHSQLATGGSHHTGFVGFCGIRMAPSVRHTLHHGYCCVLLHKLLEELHYANEKVCEVKIFGHILGPAAGYSLTPSPD